MVQETRSKVVVRLLPPSLTEDGFKKVIGEWLEATDWISYWKGKPSAPVLNHSRAYLNFKDPLDVFRFKTAFNGKNFVTDKTGQQYRCIVEYAPYQRIARKKVRPDHKENTVEKDGDYKEFLAKLEAGPEALPSAEVQLQQRDANASGDGVGSGAVGPTQTALMQYLKDKRAKKISKRILRDPASTSKGKGKGKGGGGGEGGQSKKGKQRKSKREKEAAAAAARGEGDSGKAGSKKDKQSKNNRKEKKGSAQAAGGRGGVTDQPSAVAAVKILQRPGASTAASPGGLGADSGSNTTGAAAAPKPKLKLMTVPVASRAPPPPIGGAAAAGGRGDSSSGNSKRGGRGKGGGRGGRGGGKADTAAATAGEEGGVGGGARGRGGGGGKRGRGGGRGRGSGTTAPPPGATTAAGFQPKVVPIVMVRKPSAGG